MRSDLLFMFLVSAAMAVVSFFVNRSVHPETHSWLKFNSFWAGVISYTISVSYFGVLFWEQVMNRG